ncbi:hypothetical protein SEEK5349_11480 [Salmonella enterica subsp. enterica serovar Kentucky str. 5349]|nr:hypothetical protein SEEK5349_11480 [Salmonella enterica subsp. enterica serovar Kentucky str. 5349]
MDNNFYFFQKLYSGTSRYKMNLTYTAILRYLLIEIETHEKNHISNECTGSEFRFGIVASVCHGG